MIKYKQSPKHSMEEHLPKLNPNNAGKSAQPVQLALTPTPQATTSGAVADNKHFEYFASQLEQQQASMNPTMNIINFYKILFNDVENLNLDMGEVLEMYKQSTSQLQPSTK